MTVKKRIEVLFLLIALLIVLGGEIILSAFALKANAEEELSLEYTNVFDDLKKDSSFDPSIYPDNPNDYSIKVFQVAEGSSGELFVYVYQPSGKKTPLYASSINIATDPKNLSYYNYKLTFLSQYGVFQKYKVDSFSLKEEKDRCYQITSIFRPPINDSEATVDNGNFITEVSFSVSKRFKISDNQDGSQSISVEDLESIRITDSFVGFIRYPKSKLNFFTENDIDVHFIAFSTDKKIDLLLEADVFYVSQSFEQTGIAGTKTFGNKQDKYSYLTFKDSIYYNGTSWFSNEYKWNVIEKASDFIKSEEEAHIYKMGIFDYSIESKIDDKAKQHIESKDWVLRFTHTDYEVDIYNSNVAPYSNVYSTIIGEVSILRLAFITGDSYYNLGVIDNKKSDVDGPDNKVETKLSLSDDFKDFFKLLILLLIILVFWRPFEFLLRILWSLLKGLYDFLLKFIQSIFNIIKTIFK